MSLSEPEIQGVTVVLLGSFNPGIFTTDWLARNGLTADQPEGVTSVGSLVSPQFTVLNLPRFALAVQPERFEATAPSREHFEALRDLIVGMFAILEHTPVTQLGFNHLAHYRAPSKDLWDAVGHTLAPKPVWAKYLTDPGMLSLTIRGKRPGAPDSRLDAIVQPSTQLRHGVYIQTTEHYERSGSDATAELMDVLKTRWDAMLRHALDMGAGVITASIEGSED
jgi:hypothetical protein